MQVIRCLHLSSRKDLIGLIPIDLFGSLRILQHDKCGRRKVEINMLLLLAYNLLDKEKKCTSAITSVSDYIFRRY